MVELMEKPSAEQAERPLMVTTEQAARVLGCCSRTVQRMCERGELKAVRVRSMWRINRAALMDFVEGK